MPGIVLCGRRWAIGSDDILIPAVVLCVCHFPSTIWLIVVISGIDYDTNEKCSLTMFEFLIGYLIILLMIFILEIMALIVSCRGTITDTKPRKFLQHIIYSRLVLLLVEVAFIFSGIIILINFKDVCLLNWYDTKMRNSIVSIVIGNSIGIGIFLFSILCVYDGGGKMFNKLKIFESQYKRHPSNSTEFDRNLIHRHTLDLYHKTWRQRCTKLFCCVKKRKNQAAFAVISDTLSHFFHKFDIVPSDILAGLLLLSQRQKQKRINISSLNNSETDEDFQSGVRVTSVTKVLKLDTEDKIVEFEQLIHFYQYAMASYGWPLYAYNNHCACLKLLPNIRYLFSCSSSRCHDEQHDIEIRDDNCCFCYFDGLLRQLPSVSASFKILNNKKKHIEIVYASFLSEIEKTPFFVAVDFTYKKIVIAIRGTESLQDAITDMQHYKIQIPGTDSSREWFAHKGMTHAASFIKTELEDKHLIEMALNLDKERETDKFKLLVVGHSLGGGTGTILSILLKPKYPDLKCFTYGPPGGLLSESCMLETKSFITTIVIGKDMVPRLGMYQLEKLRSDVLEVLENSQMSKVGFHQVN